VTFCNRLRQFKQMPIPIPRALVEFILLGPTDDRRQLQDSPILGDVWIAFAENPAEALDLLITPHKTQPAGHVAATIANSIDRDDTDIAYLQAILAARLDFEEVLSVLVPMTEWWHEKRTRKMLEKYGRDADDRTSGASILSAKKVEATIAKVLEAARAWQLKKNRVAVEDAGPLDRYVTLAALVLWAGTASSRGKKKLDPTATVADRISEILKISTAEALAKPLTDLFEKILGSTPDKDDEESGPLVWQISLNRSATPALTKSVPAVKADAARSLFSVNCSGIGWAVIDSGIESSHPAFKDASGQKSRVKRSFDFGNFRRVLSLNNLKPSIRKKNLQQLLERGNRFRLESETDPEALLEALAVDAKSGRSIHWELVEKFVEIDPNKPSSKPPSKHGTHVAGIIGASKRNADKDAGESDDNADGMCPDIWLYDFRVLAPDIKDTEFAIMGALQYIRYMNERNRFIAIHGANLSLSIPHDVRNFACGRTPVCEECERLVESGVVVVAAAGNHGYQNFETKEGIYEGYAAFSITDPGNSDSVITVGATHRYWPHTYGVSFFSSRGPTGDGRLKPDLVAPGERIRAPILEAHWGDLDGTSMAAPHVSGAAAMLMARYSELVGQPRKIKHILCESATNLDRERSFQGHGMLDVLRAFQSI
jgi:subtilisin family serine protease